MTTKEILLDAKKASLELKTLSGEAKNAILFSMADALIEFSEEILKENAKDVEAAKDKLSSSMIDRLSLTKARIIGMANGIREVAALPDPVGKALFENTRPDGLIITKYAVPFGVIAIIYETRPNVTSDAAALCVKSGHACVLRSGRDAYLSSKKICEVMQRGISRLGFNPKMISIVEDPSRESANELMTAKGLVDLLIPRGGKGLIKNVVENAKVPCIETGTGICHIYVDKAADLEMAVEIVKNAKLSRPSVCNAMEVLLVDKSIMVKLLPMIKSALVDERKASGLVPCELRLSSECAKIIDGKDALADDFDTEFLDYILAIKEVDGVKAAVEHILAHSTGHSEAIVSSDKSAQDYFVSATDSAAVYINASTRFTDGGEFGLGCEMGISTQKLHARGPMGLSELCTYKYIVKGEGNVR